MGMGICLAAVLVTVFLLVILEENQGGRKK